jgi:glycerate 2-kinase
VTALSVDRRAALAARAALVRDVFLATVRGFSPRALVAEALPPLPPKRATVRVIAIGKAAVPMLQGAFERWPDRIERGLAVTVAPADERSSSAALAIAGGRVEAHVAPHPIPDERSAAAAERALVFASGLSKADLVVVLISSGASSLAALPPDGMLLSEKRALVADLLASGATLRDVDLVRRHASRFKGGRLALAAGSARVLTFALGDVSGGDLHDIGSGPSVPDPTTVDDARAVLRRLAPAWEGRAALTESLKSPGAPRWRARILAEPEGFAGRLAEALEAAGVERPRAQPADEGDAGEVAARRVSQARALAKGDALVIPCEPTLRLPAERGRGGRAGWVALRALLDLPDDVVLLCAATDGADGSSGSAGAVVTAAARVGAAAGEIETALACFSDADAHERLGTRIESGLTGVHFADVHVLARLP